jgi:hypothetical protein
VTDDTYDRSERLGIPTSAPSTEELHCKRCGGETLLVTVIGKFGDQPRVKLFHCVTCDFYDWVKA